ncbi:hypothetical protein BDM02DRAFT_3191056 [Thelephora ganbajun]|uniref:Uncharacterized protein n=1 Tax=Thelephora ganbajun TaxID=370292 RepID=A0ACB6Z3I6_THEGA|nr:hypothetical protein BDM02DRAFT_3191056 [Thelephora ganbajun]
MDDLVQDYARLTSLAQFQLPSASPGAFNRVQDTLLNEILLDPHFRVYPPAPEYQLRFWKWTIQGLEALIDDEDTEIDARIYDRLVELIQSTPNSQLATRDSAPPSPSYITHYLRLCPETPNAIHRVTLLESRTTVEQGTTGLKTWPAAHALARWLGKHPERVKGKRVLELGSGVGYLGLVVAAIQLDTPEQEKSEPSIWLTDVNNVVLSRCRDNLDLSCNASARHRRLRLRQLDWFSALDADRISSVRGLMAEADPDVILGADIVYDPSIIPPLIATLHLAISANKSAGRYPVSALLALTVRRPETSRRFLDAAEEVFIITTLDITTEEIELGQNDGHSGQEIIIIQLDMKD